MKQRLELELDMITDLSPLELASKIAPLVQEAIETVKKSPVLCHAKVDSIKIASTARSYRKISRRHDRQTREICFTHHFYVDRALVVVQC